MNIYIVDDEINQLDNIKKLMEEFLEPFEENCEIYLKTNINGILENINNIDLIFLDIELEGINGIEFAKDIRKQNNDIRIIFVSNHTKYLVDGYKVHADRYFLKPINKIEFMHEMRIVLNDFIMRHRFILDKKISNSKIYVNDILYLEVLNRKTILHLIEDKKISYPYTLKWWEDYLSSFCFVQSHRAFLVNMYNISSYSNSFITLFNNEKVPLSKNYKENFRRSYFRFLNTINK